MAKVRRLARWMFYSHLWLGVLASGILLVVSVTGVMLNHKRTLGLMPEASNATPRELSEALSLSALVRAAKAAVGTEVAAAGVGRMDVRPEDGLIKVRFDDSAVTEVTLDLTTGTVLGIGERNDVFLEKLHSGEIFGDLWTLLSDAGALFLLLALISGYWLWLYPRVRAG
jgi:uncharacterized iron-regulated membrane protein